jgi:PIN domain nuclease of toxin-antitoxin system
LRALLDTHAFLWSNADPERLSAAARQFIEDPANDVFLSAVTAWEIAIKYARGRLDLPEPVDSFVASRVAGLGLSPLPVEISHAVHVAGLPRLHDDPFDRLLVAQAQLERLPILTSDTNVARYDIEVIW